MSKYRLKEIIKKAFKLGWIFTHSNENKVFLGSAMLITDVEKCMLAMTDDFELNRMRQWVMAKSTLSDNLRKEVS